MKKLIISMLALFAIFCAAACVKYEGGAAANDTADGQITEHTAPADKADAGTTPQNALPAASAEIESAGQRADATATTNDIGMEAAKKVAFDHAGLNESQVTMVQYMHTNMGREDGKTVYEINFFCENVEYEYEIDPATGKILSFDHDIDDFDINNYPIASKDTGSGREAVGDIGSAKAASIALGKVNGATSSDLRIHADTDDGCAVYEGEIVFGGKEYDFEIDAATGKVLSWDVDAYPDSTDDDRDDGRDDERYDDDRDDDWDDD